MEIVPFWDEFGDLGSRGAYLSKMESSEWYTVPQWLLDQGKCPEQPTSTTRAQAEEHLSNKIMLFSAEKKPDVWDDLLAWKPHCGALRVTAWALQFAHNTLARLHKEKGRQGPLNTEEIINARDHQVRREQEEIPNLEKPGWKVNNEEGTISLSVFTG